MTSNGTCTPDNPDECEKQGISENYWKYLVASAIVLIMVYATVFATWSVYKLLTKAQNKAHSSESGMLYSKFIAFQYIERAALGADLIGNFVILTSVSVNVAYVGLYWRRTYLLSEICLDQYDPEWKVELAFTCYFMMYFCLRLFGKYNSWEFWVDMKNIIDLITIPHIFVSIAVDRDWIGLRFLRIFWFNHILDFLRQLSIFKSQQWIDVFSLLSYFFTFWIASSGAIHAVEVTGDPWHDFETRHCNLTLLDYIYFLIVTSTTVGYGDISPDTEVGHILISLLIIVSLILVANAILTISQLVKSYSQYSGSYTQVTGTRYVVVSGYISAESIRYFLSDFLHPDRKDNYTNVLIVHTKEPDCDLKAVMRKYHRRVKFLKGSLMNSKDLKRVKITQAAAAIVLSPNYCLNPESEDESNLMRVVSIKNTCSNAKVIVQVLQLNSLQQLVRIPSWHSSIDTAICKSELKLGLMAQNCLCPGISTLLSNLIYTTSKSGSDGWQIEYMKGAGNEVYKVEIPEEFHGKLYEDVALHCFMTSQLHIMLIAIGFISDNKSEQLIYPTPFGCTIDKEMFGYFIAQDVKHVLALRNVTAKRKIVSRRKQTVAEHVDSTPLIQVQAIPSTNENVLELLLQPTVVQNSVYLYHKCIERKFNEALLTEPTCLNDHIILCTFSEKGSDNLNLHSFVSPLRSCSLQPNELKPIVIIGDAACIENEWDEIAEFDKVFIIDGSPLDQDILEVANVAQCSSCLILGSTSSLDEDPALIDKQPILCSLTLSSLDLTTDDAVEDSLYEKPINKVTELYRDENVEFLCQNDEKEDANTFIVAQPFACGECIYNSVFNSLVGVAYYNPGATALFEKLVTGESGFPAKPKQNKKSRQMYFTKPMQTSPSSYKPWFLQISLDEPKYTKFQHQIFAKLFESLLKEKKLCIGVHRCITPHKKYSKRFVITSPDQGLVLMPTDNAFVLTSLK